MSLSSLIVNFNNLDHEITKLIACDGDDALLEDFDKSSNETLQMIKEHKPAGIAELKNKFQFFVGRLKSDINNVSDAFSVNALVHMLENDFSFSMNSFNTRIGADGSISSEENKFKLVTAYDLVSKSHDRISIVDQHFRYVNTSSSNGSFYKEKSHTIIGKHVGEVIGTQRFESRAKRFFGDCFSGRKQDYFHSLKTDDGDRIMCCQMMPLYNGEANVFGSMVAMNDVTDMISDPNSILLEELN